jgi:hypothetical protein
MALLPPILLSAMVLLFGIGYAATVGGSCDIAAAHGSLYVAPFMLFEP